MDELKPCPFCGTTNELKECRFLDMVGMVYSIECKKCNDTRVMSLVSMEAAKMKWHTRPAEDALKAEVERLKNDLAIQKKLTNQACFESNRAYDEVEKWKKMFYDLYDKQARISTDPKVIVINPDTAKGGRG